MKTAIFLFIAVVMWATHAVAQQQGVIATPITDVTVTTTATLVRAYTPTRSALSCTNHGDDVVRWGSSAVTVSAGQRIPVGGSIEIRYLGAVYMIAEATAATVSCTEERR